MNRVTIVNRLFIRPGKMDEFIAAQQRFVATNTATSNRLVGGRMYRSLDGKSVVLVSQFASLSAQEELFQTEAFKQHLESMRTMTESSSPALYEEAYTYGDFR